ncbi:MAG TPA: bifunctional tRNA (5-methylaminomethyl-2-thiouridine)(34)-methyltransferase MnmD/FAD-dependent 5-carboxymethylaminomethyl-2-thiouridine(34) oxidoreductase MnmC [Burkholderiales bacterium]|nr:bifunctional tRNA (5-methylaminomethyl-2-thiouridine)(34)-methyltransferase MnmD/FAD-dependent 5-carboxymethylaminomethyl-2-thiouridine(34) oxidoreductase MnmC [Burkholderiales bacterium]
MPSPLLPARLAFAGDGTPYSREFDDVYHSAAGGPAQARHVFLAGNGLPARWAGRERFVVLETGFGYGLNFLATWQAWGRDPARCVKLHFVSVEKHPFTLQDLRTLHSRYPEFEREAAELHAAWPMLVPGAHRLELEGGRVVLTLFFADIKILRDLRLAADAIYLDGFSPARNPDMWSHALLRSVSRLAAPGATAATWSVAASVRSALEATGFAVEKAAGFGGKKEMLLARYIRKANFASTPKRNAAVIGAGLAGAAICERLCARGWQVRLIERHAAPAQEASGNHAGSFHPLVTPDDSVFARLTRSGFLFGLSSWRKLKSIRWDRCGVLQLARDDKEDASQRASIAALGLPADYAQYVTRDEAAKHAGLPVSGTGLWFPEAGWIQPQSLVNAQLEACGDRLERIFNKEVKTLEKGTLVILATANDSLSPLPHARLRRVRGQLTYIPSESIDAPRAVLLRGGMVLPPVDGVCVVGASYDLDDEDPAPRASSHAGNLERLERIIPVKARPRSLEGRVAFRTVAPDRLPLVGKLAEGVYGALAYGSRGLLWSALAAEVLASELEGEPMPVEGKLLDAMDPGRFARRARLRAGQSDKV